jgi:hypothetical protein
MKSPHNPIPFLLSLLNHHWLPSQEVPPVLSSAGLRSSLCSIGADPTENTVSIIIAQYLDCCLLIRCAGTCLPSRCLAVNVCSVSAILAFRRHVTILKLRECSMYMMLMYSRNDVCRVHAHFRMLVADTYRRWSLAARSCCSKRIYFVQHLYMLHGW